MGRGSIRIRATLGAVAVVGVALAVGSFALLVALRSAYVARVRDPAVLRAADLVEALERGADPRELQLDEGEDRFIQLVRGGSVVAASESLGRAVALAGLAGEGVRLPVGDDDDEWVVVARAVEATRVDTVVVGRELDPWLESVQAAAGALGVGLPLLLAVLGATTWSVVGRALRPVEAIRAEVDEITGAGLDRRVPEPSGDDEVARLAATMNAMLARLEDAQSRQRRFVADASHELRSPVAAIRQHAEVVLAHPDVTGSRDLADAVLTEAHRLHKLVDDMLVLARAGERAPGAVRREVDLDDVVLAEATRLRESSLVSVDTTGVGPSRVLGDERALRRAVGNLAQNAARHARTTVRLSSRTEDGVAAIEVHDDGPGVPVEHRRRIFDRFVRLDQARARDDGGVGLGLAIVDDVVRAHGGTVTVDDSPLGGARFRIELPVDAQRRDRD